MRGEDEIKELRTREARAIQSLLRLKAEILPVLAEDLVRYPEREIRKRFVSSPEFAATLDDAAIARLKAEVSQRASAMRDRVMALLDEDERWLAGVGHEGPGKSLAENARLRAGRCERRGGPRARTVDRVRIPEPGRVPDRVPDAHMVHRGKVPSGACREVLGLRGRDQGGPSPSSRGRGGTRPQ